MVKIDNLSFSYSLKGKELPVLSNINADFEKGSITAIVGKSGSGKTSLLRIIAGLTNPSSGSLTIEGEPGGRIREKTAVIFQDYGLLPWASVQANAELGLRAMHIPAEECRSRVNPILAELGLKPFAQLYPARLSGGMRQRVAVSRALASNADLLLLDEPFSSLDALTRESLQEILLETQRRHGTTVILVTHSIEEAAYLADSVYLLDGNNPSMLSTRFDTGRRAARVDPEASLPMPRAARGAAAPGLPRNDSASYRESREFFNNIAALRKLFASLPHRNETQNLRLAEENTGRMHRSRAAGFLAKAGRIILAGIFVAALWALFALILKKPFLPSPLEAFARFGLRLADGTLFIHIGASLRRIFIALALAGPPAWAFGLFAGRVKAA
ncbi:MAG: hypothetical protein CVV53_07475, partial [Spirochaetae bacterium HGW-Spirochaetae-9]